MFWRAVPRALTAATPHGSRAAAEGAGVVNEWHRVHFGRERTVLGDNRGWNEDNLGEILRRFKGWQVAARVGSLEKS